MYGVPLCSKVLDWLNLNKHSAFSILRRTDGLKSLYFKINYSDTKNNSSVTKNNFSGTKIIFSRTKVFLLAL